MRYVLVLLLAFPGLAHGSGHSGVVAPRTGPELSDLALFAMAVAGVWLVRRRLRARPRDADARRD